MISVLVLTLNEEANLARCLESVRWSDDVVVLDSYSNDQTLDIARTFGARVVQRQFDDWASHQNWANENIAFKNPWVYYSDADEVVSHELRDEMLSAAVSNDMHVAYWVRYKNFFLEKWIAHCGIYPVWALRLFRPQCVRWERSVNPVPVIEGAAGKLSEHFLHYSFNKGLNAWFEKHNKYSWNEALETIQSLQNGAVDWRGIVDITNAPRRRRALKTLSFRLPGRPLLRFIYMYFLRLGLLDGRAGFHYCVMLSIYEYMIVMKVMEIFRRANGKSI